jgi:hypothetical protein
MKSFTERRKILNSIPEGQYCYDEKGRCPYWSKKSLRAEQYNGWCNLLNKGDLEIAKETMYTDLKTGEETSGYDLGFPVSLLWDQCKECGYKK